MNDKGSKNGRNEIGDHLLYLNFSVIISFIVHYTFYEAHSIFFSLNRKSFVAIYKIKIDFYLQKLIKKWASVKGLVAQYPKL